VVFYPHTTVVHLGGESAKSEGAITAGGRQLQALQSESTLLYFRKNHGLGGALQSLLLSTLASAIVLAKRLLKGRPLGWAEQWRLVAEMWRLWSRTRWGTQPTR
jgi:hypothetical protein